MYLPFDHEDVRVYVDNHFTDGLLFPTDRIPYSLVAKSWMAIGVAGSESTDKIIRFKKLLQLVLCECPTADSDHQTWIHAAMRWAEVVALRWSSSEDVLLEDRVSFDAAHQLIEQNFQEWMIRKYSSVHSLSHLPRPVMLHHIPKYMAHRLAQKKTSGKLAIIVVDGLSMDQWAVIRKEFPPRKWVTEEFGLFAWVPTLTTVSRQAIFAGEPPFYYTQSLDTTSKEERHWRRVWDDLGIRKGGAIYACQGMREDDDAFIKRIIEQIDKPRCNIAGIVVGTIDQMLHGIVNGTDGMHASIRHWAKRGSLFRLLDAILELNFEVIITADHGNIEGVGIGKPDVGATANERGERVHVFSDHRLRSNVAKNYPGSLEWPCIGLPDDYLALIAPPLRAFTGVGKRIVGHGGICIEEAIVPFVTITKVS